MPGFEPEICILLAVALIIMFSGRLSLLQLFFERQLYFLNYGNVDTEPICAKFQVVCRFLGSATNFIPFFMKIIDKYAGF